MKRRAATIVGVLLAALVLNGCTATQPRTIWKTPPQSPTTNSRDTPVVGSCHMTLPNNVHDLNDAAPIVDCTAAHNTETFHLGALTDAAMTAIARDDWEVAHAVAFTTCNQAAPEFLGGDWRAARVALTWYFPTRGQREKGARWIRCDMYEEPTLRERTPLTRTGSLRDGLRGARPLAITCATHTNKNESTVDVTRYVACTSPHTIEYTGTSMLRPASRPYPGDRAVNRLALAECQAAGRHYTGAPIRTGMVIIASGPTSSELWARGDRMFRCFLGIDTDQRQLKGSIRGIGNRPLLR